VKTHAIIMNNSETYIVTCKYRQPILFFFSFAVWP